jgi:hypothetical protein
MINAPAVSLFRVGKWTKRKQAPLNERLAN